MIKKHKKLKYLLNSNKETGKYSKKTKRVKIWIEFKINISAID